MGSLLDKLRMPWEGGWDNPGIWQGDHEHLIFPPFFWGMQMGREDKTRGPDFGDPMRTRMAMGPR